MKGRTMGKIKFSVGPWNVSEGGDRFGPPVRKTISLAEKIKKFKQIGIDAIQFHDDDVVVAPCLLSLQLSNNCQCIFL